jgi:hypothetical protein
MGYIPAVGAMDIVSRSTGVIAFYEKVIKVKADVAAYLN